MLVVGAREAKKGADRGPMAHLQMTTHAPSTHTNRQKSCLKMLFHGDRGEGHNHIITPDGKEEERRVLARMCLTSGER